MPQDMALFTFVRTEVQHETSTAHACRSFRYLIFRGLIYTGVLCLLPKMARLDIGGAGCTLHGWILNPRKPHSPQFRNACQSLWITEASSIERRALFQLPLHDVRRDVQEAGGGDRDRQLDRERRPFRGDKRRAPRRVQALRGDGQHR